MAEEGTAAAQEAAAQQQFVTQRIYTKDISFESPMTPNVFRQEWKPAVNVDLNTKSSRVDEEGNQTPLGLNYQGIFVVAVKAIQELNTELQAEKEKTRALEDKVEALEDHLTRFTVQVTARLAALESQK
mgnify:CR=1 FL=1